LSDSNGAGGRPSEQDLVQPEEQEAKSVTFSWGILMVRTKRLLNFLDQLARYRIFSDLGWVYIAITVAAGAFMIWLMLDETYIVLNSSLQARCLIGAAAPSLCHANNYTVTTQPALTSYLLKSTGLLFFLIVPIGAFVEIDDKLIQKTRARDSGRIMAGGPGSNVIVAVIALILLVLLLGGLVPKYNGVLVAQVYAPSPANTLHQQGHLQAGDFIQAVNGTKINSDQDLANYMAHTTPNETLQLTIDHQGQLNTYPITLGANPSNTKIGFIGVTVSNANLSAIKTNYANAYRTNPFLYLIVPGIIPQAETLVPFSSTLHSYYNSPVLGVAWDPVALTLFWIFFININLAFFNAIPLYPLDGGQAIYNWFSHFGKKWVEVRAKMLTTICSLAMFLLILTFLFLPRILALLPY
jgi:membrane-associated protease RseP (regulator of RpoE activity)